MSQDHNHLNHATWECKYHVVFTPKYRKKLLFGQIRRHLGTVFHELAKRKECKIEEGHLMPDDVHMLLCPMSSTLRATSCTLHKRQRSCWYDDRATVGAEPRDVG